MLEKFLKQTSFVSQRDFEKNFELIIPENFNFAYDVMDEWAAIAPDKLALLWTNDKDECIRFSFKDIKEQSDRTAAYFQSLGIGKGDMVMILLKRRYEFWLTILALHKLGAVAIPATHLLRRRDIVYRNNKAGIKAIICAGDEYILNNVTRAMPDSPSVKILVSIGPIVPEGFHDFHKEWMSAPAFVRPQHVNTNDDSMIIYFTSGTSGEPKMVAHDYTYALGHLATGVFWHNLSEDSLHLTIADTGWGKAVWGKLYGQWFAGAAVFVYDHEKFHPEDVLHKIEQYHITSFCAPPTVYRFMLQEDFSKYDLSSLRYCCTAGEALNASVFDEFEQKTGISIKEAYGQTETTLTVGTFPWQKSKPGSMGLPSPQYKMEVVRPDGTPCDVRENGELVIDTRGGKPIGLFKGYYLDPERTKEVWHDGFYHTCDVVYKDEDGFLWFVGRTDDIIKSSGYRVSPFEVESVLMLHPAVVECAVTGVPDPIRGAIVKATIVLAEGWKKELEDANAKEHLAKEIQTFVKEQTAPYKYPRVIEFVEELPKTISGKIRRVEIRNSDSK